MNQTERKVPLVIKAVVTSRTYHSDCGYVKYTPIVDVADERKCRTFRSNLNGNLCPHPISAVFFAGKSGERESWLFCVFFGEGGWKKKGEVVNLEMSWAYCSVVLGIWRSGGTPLYCF